MAEIGSFWFYLFFQSDLKFISLIELKEAEIDFTDCLHILSFSDYLLCSFLLLSLFRLLFSFELLMVEN